MRLFVGLDLPFELRQRVATLSGGGIPGARWVPPENYHVTLRFIGEAPRYLAEEIDHSLAALKAPAFPLTLAGIGTFAKGGRSQSLWLGVERCELLERLQGKIETALQRCGLEPDRRRFLPHVALAKCESGANQRLIAYVQGHNLVRTEPVMIDRFVLFSSLLGNGPPLYTIEREYELSSAHTWRRT